MRGLPSDLLFRSKRYTLIPTRSKLMWRSIKGWMKDEADPRNETVHDY